MDNLTLARLAHQSGPFRTVIYYPVIHAANALHPHTHVDMDPAHNNLLLQYTPVIKNGVVVENSYTPM
jgi:hypothetical protein